MEMYGIYIIDLPLSFGNSKSENQNFGGRDVGISPKREVCSSIFLRPRESIETWSYEGNQAC